MTETLIADAMKTAAKHMGREMKDVTSGVRGIVVTASLQPNGTLMLGLQPEGDGKTRPETHFLDIPVLDDLGDGVSKRAAKPLKPKFKLGDQVKNRGSTFAGTVVAVAWHINGCVQYSVTPEHLSDRGLAICQGFVEAELEKAGPPKASVAEAAGASGRGGPAVGEGRVVR